MSQCANRTAEIDILDFSLPILMMTMITPLSSGYLLSWLILPFAVLTQGVLAAKGSIIIWWSLPALALLALALPFPRSTEIYGNTLFAALLLFIGFSIELLRSKRAGRP